jgi:peptidoglycan/LPS O-acetylase OafA/YrhL
MYRFSIAPFYRHGWGYTVHGTLLAVLMVQLMTLQTSRYWRWLENPIVRAGGLISYSMYLYHLWGLAVGARFKMLPLTARVFIGMSATVAMAIPSYWLVERSCMRMKDAIAPAPAKRT